MSLSLLNALGGLGLFLLGMRIMTEGLRALAGDRLHRWLARVTRTPLSGATTGAVTTAVVQSSTATTVAAVGFVGAGLLTFEQSLGVIFGANIGTTITGWIVAIVGFKIKLGYFSLLLVFLGTLAMLISKRGWTNTGRAVAGFGLLFLGLEFLKTGMAAADGLASLRDLAPDNVAGRLLLVALGVLVTLITQSSSATVATTLAGLSAGLLSMPQALAMVIGADIGTTGTALLATIGTSRSSRRTGWSHVIYNLLTGLGAFLLLPVYVWAVRRIDAGLLSSNAQLVTVAFHSLFNILGVIAILPVTRPFARLMYRLVPAGEPSPTASLEPRLVETPAAAIETLRQAVTETTALTVDLLARELEDPAELPTDEQLVLRENATAGCRDFIAQLATASRASGIHEILPEFIHVLDHVDRLLDRCRDKGRVRHLTRLDAAADDRAALRSACHHFTTYLRHPGTAADPGQQLEAIATELEADRHNVRRTLIDAATGAGRHPADLDKDLDALRWLRRCAWHVSRLSHHLARAA